MSSDSMIENVRTSTDSTESGQGLVEAALVFILVLMLMAGLVEFGWAYFRYLALQDAAGEGAAYSVMFPRQWYNSTEGTAQGIPSGCHNPDPNNIAYRVRHESQSTLVDWSNASVDIDGPFITPGNQITVTVAIDHELITPLVSTWVPDGVITLRATAVQSIVAPTTTASNTCS